MRPVFVPVILALLAGVAAPNLAARPARLPSHPVAEAQTLDLAKQLIAIRSVQGEGNRTGDALQVVKGALVAGGWRDSDVTITPLDDTAYMIAVWPGTDAALKPLIISGHMDVVEAKPADWQRDPFTPVIEEGYMFGRGASDMKYSAAMAVSSLIELRREGYKPRRSIVIALSGDEETSMKTTRVLAGKLSNAGMVLNIDGGGGLLDEKNGKALYLAWDGAEKTYVDYKLEVTNPGGHSSAPRPDNAIVQLAQALEKVGAYRFKPEQNPVTKAWFEKAAQFEGKPELAAAMRAYAANIDDTAAIATLRASPAHVGKVSTTCVPTMLSGGHAQNALPQRATANINCRVFPGHTREEVRAELERAIGMPMVKVTDVSGGDTTESPASAMRPDFEAALNKAVKLSYPGIAIIPSQASGASDSMWFRAKGIDSYGMSPIFMKDSDDFSHGLNERVPLSNTAPGIVYFLSMLTDLSK